MQRAAPGHTGVLLAALTVAWALSGAILLAATFLQRLLGERGLMALERLMGMLLVMRAGRAGGGGGSPRGRHDPEPGRACSAWISSSPPSRASGSG